MPLKLQKKAVSFIMLIIICITTSGQDTVYINEVKIESSGLNLYSSAKNETVDSVLKKINRFSNADELLNLQTSSQIKSYGGLGNLASIHLRGTGANHTCVNWNGFPINSVSTGTTDLSLIHSDFFEEIKIIPGASSSIYGSGTFGGAVELINKQNWDNSFEIKTGSEIGSFNSQKYFGDIHFSGNKIDYRVYAIKVSSENNFKFVDIYKLNNPVEYREHNALNSLGIIQNLNLKLPAGNYLESSIWYFTKNKEIPKIAGSYSESNKFQTDSTLKVFLRYKKIFKRSILRLSTAFLYDFFRYTDKINSDDPEFTIYSEITGNKFLGDLSYRYYFNQRFNFDLAAITDHSYAITSNYININSKENNYSVLSAVKYTGKHSDIKFSFRNEFSELIGYYPLFDLGIKFKPLNNDLSFRANFSNKFRKPTFNERYWQPGGNINLTHETGINCEIGADQVINKGTQHKFTYGITTYKANINDMIQWIPVEGSWTAVNNEEVKCFGLELNIKYLYMLNNLQIVFYSTYSYNSSNITETEPDDIAIKKQLIYTPFHSNKSNLIFSYKKFTTAYSFLYAGKRYTTADNDPLYELEDYSLSNLYMSYDFEFKKINMNFNVRLLNLLNKNYEVIRSYISPGRSVYFSIIFAFKKKKL